MDTPTPLPTPTRKNTTPINVWVTPEEKAQIKALAQRTGHSTSSLLRTLGLGYEVRGIVDHQQVEALARINGDLGRLGGLLKLWLSRDPRTATVDEATLRAVLAKIEDTQDEMIAVMKSVVRPRSQR
ncbi:conjugal transfer transcriptional regulator TraJ [Methylococcus sp. EFPC2]|uniref:conjugal transfer transcriptional regulator TraJ n=1 Tax=Methylococcus sp. EFPC2 TaxID=2812648 RepID=UPI0019685A32|nr:conjugal transfer transcriptional regulator TraJ [Methylococcus sp. EFPC2]QSA99325.1 conjugal transfer transcriptional regulator TraJ [Methylococcus sp. EFPC2]